jgi:cyclic 2,3-diphosphoglycerate synthetase
MPPIATDAWVLAVGAHQSMDYVTGYMGPYRIRMADLCILTMCEEPMADERKISEMAAAIRELNPSAKLLRAVFRPNPLGDIRNERVLFTTTAPPAAGKNIVDSLEEKHGCEVVAVSHNLSNRPKLRNDIARAIREDKPSVLLTELKAAAVDVATAAGLEAGLRVVFADNVLLGVNGEAGLAEEIINLAELAVERFNKREQNENSP